MEYNQRTQEVQDAIHGLLEARDKFVARARAHGHEPGYKADLTAVNAAEKVIHDNAEKWLVMLLNEIGEWQHEADHFRIELEKAMDVMNGRR